MPWLEMANRVVARELHHDAIGSVGGLALVGRMVSGVLAKEARQDGPGGS